MATLLCRRAKCQRPRAQSALLRHTASLSSGHTHGHAWPRLPVCGVWVRMRVRAGTRLRPRACAHGLVTWLAPIPLRQIRPGGPARGHCGGDTRRYVGLPGRGHCAHAPCACTGSRQPGRHCTSHRPTARELRQGSAARREASQTLTMATQPRHRPLRARGRDTKRSGKTPCACVPAHASGARPACARSRVRVTCRSHLTRAASYGIWMGGGG